MTTDVFDPFHQVNVKVIEEDDESYLVENIANNDRRRFLKKDDVAVSSMIAIENPLIDRETTEELYSYLNNSKDDEGANSRIQEQLRIEETFGSYSKINREQSIHFLGKFVSNPKDMVIIASPSPNVDLESDKMLTEEQIFSLAPNSKARSQLIVPIVDGKIKKVVVSSLEPSEEQEPSGEIYDGEEDVLKTFKNTGMVDLLLRSYESLGIDQNMELSSAPTAPTTMTQYMNPVGPTRFMLEKRIVQLPSVPVLLYDVRETSAMNYNQLKIKTCIRPDSMGRSILFNDINVPIFSSPLTVPLTDSHLTDIRVKGFFRQTAKKSSIPLMVAPYSHVVIPTISDTKIGQDTDLMNEEFERHYVSLSREMVPHPMNSMDQYVYHNLYQGIDVYNNNPSKDTLQPYREIDWNSGLLGYVPLPNIPNTITINETSKQVLDWALAKFPLYRPLVEHYKMTKTPQVWFEFLSELHTLETTSTIQIQEDYLNAIRAKMGYDKTFKLDEIKADVEEKQLQLRSEQSRAEKNLSVCYGLSIRKLYTSLESFKDDIASQSSLYWDSDRDSLSDDNSFLRRHNDSVLRPESNEEAIYAALEAALPFISATELKRRAHEVRQFIVSAESHPQRSLIRPGDLIMVRLVNATYVYERTADGWNGRTRNLGEHEFCETKAKGYMSLTPEQLTGKDALQDGCTFIHKKCVPNSVQKWIDLLEQIEDVKEQIRIAETVGTDIHQRKDKIQFILERMLTYVRVLPELQTSDLGNDSWAHLTMLADDIDSKKLLYKIMDEYEKARSIPDFVEQWLQVETILDRNTTFDETIRAYVDPVTRTQIACEHTTMAILAAKGGPKLRSKLMKQMLQEYGNFDEVGQQTVCKICGEVIGDIVVSANEGFGSDDAPIQVRSVTEVAVNTDYQSLSLPIQKLYKQIIELKNQSGISLNESEVANVAKMWYTHSITNELFETMTSIHLLNDGKKRLLLRQLFALRKKSFLEAPEQKQLLDKMKTQTKARRDKLNNALSKKLQREIQSFLKNKVKEFVETNGSMKPEDEDLIRDYFNSIRNISREVRGTIFNQISTIRSMANTIHAFVLGIQTSKEVQDVGLASIPGVARITREALYDTNSRLLYEYLIYIYAKKNQFREQERDSLRTIVNQIETTETIQKAIQDGLRRLQTLLQLKLNEEQRLQLMDRVFTPSRDPFATKFRDSFVKEHPIQDILETYKVISENTKVEFDPNSIAANTWMNYDERGRNMQASVNHQLYHKTLGVDIQLSRFPLQMSRLESMKKNNDVHSIEEDILSFSARYDLNTGKSLRKLLLRSGGKIADLDDFMLDMNEKIPSVLLKKHKDWIESWLSGYMKYAGSVGSLLEYDLGSHTFIDVKIEKMRKKLSETRAEVGDDINAYRKNIKLFRNQIRLRVGGQNQISLSPVKIPQYESVPRIEIPIIPEWYVNYQTFINEQIGYDKERLINYLTQMNVKGDQASLVINTTQDSNRYLYDLDFKYMMTTIFFEMFRLGKQGDEPLSLIHKLANGSELVKINDHEVFETGELESLIKTVLYQYGQISETSIENHKAEVLAKQNIQRKLRADAFTDEEKDLNQMHRQFGLGSIFKSFDELNIEQGESLITERFNEAELVDPEAADDLIMGFGDDDGQYEDGEYDVL